MPFRALLDAQHRGVEVAVRWTRRINTNEEDITALGEQLPQFTAQRIREMFTRKRECESGIR
jgi:hypothetical protein